MSARSSSGSWSGGGGSPADIIDLDRFMRGAVRPPRAGHNLLRCGDKLVVDAGGVERKPAPPAASPPAPTALASAPAAFAPAPADFAPAPVAPAPPSGRSDSSGSRVRPHGKHYSHDSGLSDTSYARRKHRPHRRAVGGDNAGVRPPRTPAAGSSDSLRAFRAVCERALLDQQAQIARVAQLCERLSERATAAPRHSDRSLTDTSDVSSSSRSTRDQRRKDKHRLVSSSSTNQPVSAQTDECKTYKIIMNKLDELSRLFATRASPPPPVARRPPPSSGSVSVSDKLVATEPPRALSALRGGSTYGACGAGGAGAAGGCVIANTCALDIAPRAAMPRHNIATESVVQCESRARTNTSGGDPRCGFDLDDPVHLYSQAKRLQAMSATTRRARSVDPAAQRSGRSERYERDERDERYERDEHTSAHGRERSLCALCRGYWRSLTHYLAVQIFCCPDAAVVGALACKKKPSCRPPRCPGGCKPKYW